MKELAQTIRDVVTWCFLLVAIVAALRYGKMAAKALHLGDRAVQELEDLQIR